MASRSNTKFQKRKKEFARAEKRQDKAARKARRKLEKGNNGEGPPVEAIDPLDLGLPPLPEANEEEEEGAKGQ